MSIGLIDWALKQAVYPSAAKFVLVALANYADENDYCYPSQSRLALDTGQSERSVRAHIAQLEADGWIKRDQRRRPNGSFTSDAFTIQRQISPAANLASGKKRRQPAAKSAAPEPSLEPLDTKDAKRERFNRMEADLRAAAGACLNDQSFALSDLTRPLAWVASGCDWELDVLPTVKTVSARAGPKAIRGWKYFEPAVADAKANRLKPMPEGRTDERTHHKTRDQISRDNHIAGIASAVAAMRG